MINKYLHRVWEFVATGFYTGYMPFMPGTFGTLIGVGIFLLLSRYGAFYYILLFLLLLLAVKVSDYAEKHIFKMKDPSHIVIDEVIGYMIAMISFQFDGSIDSIKYAAIGFVLFRLFDIWKPYPIKHSQNLPGGTGIVIDDVLAGIYANLFLQFLRMNGSLFIK